MAPFGANADTPVPTKVGSYRSALCQGFGANCNRVHTP